MLKTKFKLTTLAFFAFSMILSATLNPVFADKKNDTLVVAVQRMVRSIDRLYTTRREGLILAQLTEDALFYVNPKTFKYEPLVAKSYKFIDEKTLDVTIRDNVKFHDGSTLTADDVVYTYEWVLNKKSKARKSKTVRRWLKSVKKTGTNKIRFKLKHAYPLALRDMSVSIYLRKKGTYHNKKGSFTGALNGVGPYKVVEFIPGKKAVLERFDKYYNGSPKGKGKIKKIIFRSIPDWGTQQAEIMSGGVQWMYSVPTDIAENLGKNSSIKHIIGPSMRVGFVVMDAIGYTGKKNPFTKLEVRQAMNHAINKEAIVKYIVKGISKPIHSPCHPIQFGCSQEIKKYNYDPAKAKELLKKAGYPNGFKFQFWAYREKAVAEAIVADLAKDRINAKMRYVKTSTLGRARKSREIPAYFGTWGSGSTADAAAILGPHFSPRSNRNLSRDLIVEKYLLKAERTLDKKKRVQFYNKGLSILADKALWVPLYSFTLNYLVSKDLAFKAPSDGLPRLVGARWK